MKLIEFPSIKNFEPKKVFKQLQTVSESKKLKLVGTVKMHGTNFSVVYDNNENELYFQSRNNVLEKGTNFFNYQEIAFNPINQNSFMQFFKSIRNITDLANVSHVDQFILFGELVGGEIQKGVAFEGMEKKFIVFDIAYMSEGELRFLDYEFLGIVDHYFKNNNVRNMDVISNFPVFEIEMDLSNESNILEINNILSKHTSEIEKECPVAKYFGINGVGEGIVWRSNHNNFMNGFGIRFKVKGDEHTNSKVRTLNPIDQEKISKLKSLEEVCNAICTESRFKQGMQFLIENNIEESNKKNTFMRWVVEDTLKEEMDFIIEKGLSVQDIKAQLFKNSLQYWNDMRRENYIKSL